MHSYCRILLIFTTILYLQVLSVNCSTRPIRDFIDYNAREDGDNLIGLPTGPVPSYVLPPSSAARPPVNSNLSRKTLSRKIRSRSRSTYTSDLRLIRDFIDYNAREDGDHMIALPSGPVPSYAVRPLIAKPGSVDDIRGNAQSSNRKMVRQKPNLKKYEDFELSFRDESRPGGRRGN